MNANQQVEDKIDEKSVMDIISTMVVVGAVSYTLWALVRSFRPGSAPACGDCSGCAVKKDLQASLTTKNNSHVTGKHLSQF